jgi:signal transduction histidine kinase
MRDRVAAARSPLFLVLTAAISIAVSALGIFGYRAGREWQRSATVLARRASQDGADLLVTALLRDMRGAQALVLANRDAGDYATQALPDFSSEVSAAFTRFPYPESFFGWRATDGDIVFFNRANRRPPWTSEIAQSGRYPVLVVRNPAIGLLLFTRIVADAHSRGTYSDFRIPIGGEPYEVVARLQYADPFRDRLASVTGFTVNLKWARERYFNEIVAQVARIGSTGMTLDYAVVDDAGRPVTGTLASSPSVVRSFPLQFFDPSTSEVFTAVNGAPPVWTVRVTAANDANVILATHGADWALIGVGATTFALVFSFFLLTRAVRTSASLADMRNEFVSTVTHELKTPIATIRAIADTMRRGRLDGGGIRDYAGLLVQESRRLTRLVDNLLAYARVTDVSELYADERVAPAELIEESISGFQQQLTDGNFEVVADVPHDLPLVRGDRTALRLALDNLIDNAIRYSADRHWIRVGARRDDARVIIEVRDRGVGIAADEIERVQRKFVRGQATRTHGSGLGLAIVNRVAAHHAGHFELRSEPGVGTIATFDVPVCGD